MYNGQRFTNDFKNKFDTIDYEKAKAFVKPFIKDQCSLDLWSSDFFKSITENIDVNQEEKV